VNSLTEIEAQHLRESALAFFQLTTGLAQVVGETVPRARGQIVRLFLDTLPRIMDPALREAIERELDLMMAVQDTRPAAIRKA
jgi:hypothetical protein